jgi:hypothetical protein
MSSMVAEKLAPAGADIKLQKQVLTNFKGLKSFALDARGGNINIYGDNATGKTTLYDAFLWLFFDKDSSNRTAFNVKTLDRTGEAIHMLEHTVEAELVVNHRAMTMKKTMSEKWTKRRGESQKIFNGHETLYWVDEVPVKAGEYKQIVAGLISEGLFRLITNPMFFNVDLPWKDRRKTLLEICGDVSDDEVIASNEKLRKLAEVLNGKGIDDYKKIAAEKIKSLKEEKEKISPRVDELNRTLEGEEPDYDLTERQLVDAKASMERIEKQMVSASEINAEYRKKQAQLNGLHSDLNKKRAELDRQANAGRNALVAQERDLTRTFADLSSEISILESRQKLIQQEIDANTEKLNALREEWQVLKSQTFTVPGADQLTCLYCGQELPADQREEKITKAQNDFEAKKQQAINKNVASGKALKTKNEELAGQLAVLEQHIGEKQAAKNDTQVQLDAVKAKLDEPHETASVENHPEYIAIQTLIDTLQAELDQPGEDATTGLLEQKREVTREIEALNRILNNKDVRAKTTARIQELHDEEMRLAEQISDFEGHQFLMEEFVKAKVNMLEEQINSRFRMVTFKLFNTQINGGIEECCEALINGVPFSDANNAARINAGLDIINTLTQHYGVSAPVFIDNAEAVNELLPIDSQVIRLIVSKDEALRVEMEA